jgi:hypothetical protein
LIDGNGSALKTPTFHPTFVDQMTKKKAGFNTTGKSDREGKENEKFTVKVFNEQKVYPVEVEHRGGSRLKEDAVAGPKKISIKRMENINSGSHDWVNLSSAVSDGLFGDTFDEFLAHVKELRSLPKDIRSDDEFKLKVSEMFDNVVLGSFDYFNSDNIIKVLKKGLIDSCADFDVAVNDVATSKIYIYPANRHPVFDYVEKGFTAYLKGNVEKKSRTIYFKDSEGNDYDTGIRMRVCNNNGISAFLGVSNSNSNSQVVIKLQQDKVGRLLRSVDPRVVTY